MILQPVAVASQVEFTVGMREIAGDAERAPSDARVSARGRSVEVGLDVGRVAFNVQNDVCGEKI